VAFWDHSGLFSANCRLFLTRVALYRVANLFEDTPFFVHSYVFTDLTPSFAPPTWNEGFWLVYGDPDLPIAAADWTLFPSIGQYGWSHSMSFRLVFVFVGHQTLWWVQNNSYAQAIVFSLSESRGILQQPAC